MIIPSYGRACGGKLPAGGEAVEHRLNSTLPVGRSRLGRTKTSRRRSCVSLSQHLTRVPQLSERPGTGGLCGVSLPETPRSAGTPAVWYPPSVGWRPDSFRGHQSPVPGCGGGVTGATGTHSVDLWLRIRQRRQRLSPETTSSDPHHRHEVAIPSHQHRGYR